MAKKWIEHQWDLETPQGTFLTPTLPSRFKHHAHTFVFRSADYLLGKRTTVDGESDGVTY